MVGTGKWDSDKTYDGDFAPDLEGALLVLVVGEDGRVCGEPDDGAGGLHAEDLWEGLDRVQALPG